MKQLQLVFIIPTVAHGGAQRVLYEIVTHLDRDLFDCQIICFYKSESPYNFINKAKIHYLNSEKGKPATGNSLLRITRRWLTIWQLRKALKSFNDSAILIPFMARPATAYAVLSQLFLNPRKRIVASLHTAESVYIKFNYRSQFKRNIEGLFLKIACLGADSIVLHSEPIKTDLIRNYSIPAEKMEIIPNPLDIDAIKALSLRTATIDRMIDTDKFIFSHIGRLSVEKNHLLFIKAISLLKKRGCVFKAVIAGAGNQDKYIREWIEEFGVENDIQIVGALDNPYSLMAKSRALVLTSHYDASPMVLREAMASGTAVISVDCPFGPKDILENGKYGLLVPASDPEALADAMQLILNDDNLFRELRQKGLNHSVVFDTAVIIKKWEKILYQNIETRAQKKLFSKY